MQRQGRDALARLSILLERPLRRYIYRCFGFFNTPSLSASVVHPGSPKSTSLFKALKSVLLRKGAILVIAALLVPCSALFTVLNKVPTAHAAPSTNLNFQGRLLSSSGNLVADGFYNINFKIYNVATDALTPKDATACTYNAGTPDPGCLWTEQYYDSNGVTAGNDNRVRVVNGYFSVKLGSQTAFGAINWDQQLWLVMNIGGSTQTATPTYDGEMTPRIQLTAVPLAFVANNVNSGSTSTASTNSANVSIASGNATGTTSNSGDIAIDSGTATGTKGAITLGASNASALTLGRAGLTTSNAGSLTVTQLITGNLGLTVTGATVSLNASSSFATNINTGTGSGNVGILNGTGTGTVGIGNSAAGAITIQSGSTIGLTGTTSVTGLAAGSTTAFTVNTGAASNKGILVKEAGSQSANPFEIQTSSSVTPVARFNPNGDLLIGSSAATDSATALQVKQNGGSSVFVVDANNLRVGIGNGASAPSATLQVDGTFTTAGGTASINVSSSNATNINTGSGSGNVGILNGTGTGTVGIGNTASGALSLQSGASITLDGAVATTISLGSATQTGKITVGQSTATNTIEIGSGNVAASATQTITVGGGTTGGTAGGLVLNLGTGIPAASAPKTIHIGDGGTTTGTVNITVGSNGAAAHTTVIQGGNGAGAGTEAIRIAPAAAGAIAIGGTSQTGIIYLGQSTATNTISIGSAASTGTQTISIGAGTPTGAGLTNVTIGNIINGGAVNLLSGTGNINLQAAGTSTIGVIQVGAGGVGNATPDYLGLDVKSTTGDPAGGAEGYMYYNTFDNKFRCFQGAAWTDCIGGGSSTSLQGAYTTSAGATPSIAVNSTNLAVTVQNSVTSGIAAGTEYFGVRLAGASDIVLGASVFTVNSGGIGVNIGGTGNPVTTADLSFGAGNRTINVVQGTSPSAGGNLTLSSASANGTTGLGGGAIGLTAGNGSNKSSATGGIGGAISITAGNGGAGTGVGGGSGGAGGAITIQGGTGGTTVDVIYGTGGTVSVLSGNSPIAGGTAGDLILDVGTSAGAPAISLGNSTNSIAKTITVGGTTQTGTITVGQSTASNTINIGNANTATGNTQAINIGAGTPAGTGLTNITVGNILNGGAVNLLSGTGNINLQVAGTGTVGRIQIGAGGVGNATPDYLGLDVKSTTGDPAGGAEGYMYYNTFDNKFRCFQGAAWTDCIGAGGSTTLQNAYDNSSSPAIILTSSATKSVIVKAGVGFDQTSLFQVQNAAGTGILTVDSANGITTAKDLTLGTVSGTRLFSDSFESGNLKLWTAQTSGSSTVATDTAHARTGKYAVKINRVTTGQSDIISPRQNDQTPLQYHIRGYFYFTALPGSNVYLASAYNLSSGFATTQITVYYNQATNKLAVWRASTGTGADSSATLALNTWNKIDMIVTIGSGVSGAYQLFLNDTSILNNAAANTGTVGPDEFVIGDATTTNSSTTAFWVDDFAVDHSTVVTTSAALSVDDSLHVGGSAYFGSNIFLQNAADSTAALDIKNSFNSSILTVDTTNASVKIDAGDNNGGGSTSYGLCFGSTNTECIASKRTAGGNQFGLDFYTQGNTVASFSSIGAATLKNSTNSTAAFQVQNSSSQSIFNVDTTAGVVGVGGPGGYSDTVTKLTNPSNLPAGQGNDVSFSNNGTYMAVAHSTTPFVTIYKRSGDTFTKLADPASLPASTGNDVAWSPDDTYMAVAHTTTPFVTIYKRSGDTFTKLADPASLPASTGNKVAFSPDTKYMTVAHFTSPFITIYKRSGDTFTKLADPATLPAGTANSVAFSPDGVYMAVGNTTSTPRLAIYKRSGDTFTKLSDPSNLPTNDVGGVAWSPDGTYLSAAWATTPFVSIFKRSGDTFTKQADPTLPANQGFGTNFSPDGTYMAVAHSNTPFVTIYKGTGTATSRLEVAIGTTADEGLGFGKDLQLYRSSANNLNLAAGGNLSLDNGNLNLLQGYITVSGEITQKTDSNTALLLQDSTGTYNNLGFDSSNNHLRLYAFSGRVQTEYLEMYYDGAANIGVLAASTGVTQIGAGAGTINLATASTVSGSMTFSGVTTDITTGTNEALTISPNGTGDIVLSVDNDSNVQLTGTVTSTSTQDLQSINLTNQTSSGTQNALVITNVDDAANATTESLLTLANAETAINAVTDYLNITAAATDTTANAINVSDSDLFNGIYLGANFARFDGVRIFEGTTGTLTIEDTSGNDLMTIVDGGTVGNVTITGTLTVANITPSANLTIGTSDTTGTLLVLDTKTNIADPTGVAGGMYYNSSSKQFRCYENGSWENCVSGLTNQDAWWIRSGGGTTTTTAFVGVGVQAPLVTGTLTSNNASDAVLTQVVTAASIAATGGYTSQVGAYNSTRRNYNTSCSMTVRTGGALPTGARVFVGLISALPANANDSGGNHIGFRYSTVAGDTGVSTGWRATTRDGTTNTIAAANVGSSANIAISTTYKLKMRIDDTNATVYMSVNGGTEDAVTATLPAAATALGYSAIITSSDTNADTFNFGKFYCEQN